MSAKRQTGWVTGCRRVLSARTGAGPARTDGGEQHTDNRDYRKEDINQSGCGDVVGHEYVAQGHHGDQSQGCFDGYDRDGGRLSPDPPPRMVPVAGRDRRMPL